LNPPRHEVWWELKVQAQISHHIKASASVKGWTKPQTSRSVS